MLICLLEGLSVDEAFTLFDEGFGVKKSKEMRREKIQMQQTYNTPAVITEGVEKSEVSQKENADPIKSIGKEGSE